jgi:hypothetical protein
LAVSRLASTERLRSRTLSLGSEAGRSAFFFIEISSSIPSEAALVFDA